MTIDPVPPACEARSNAASMTLMSFVLGLALVTGAVVAWSWWDGAGAWAIVGRAVATLVAMQLGYFAFVIWTARRPSPAAQDDATVEPGTDARSTRDVPEPLP